jgi:adenylate kinase family enzyme
MTTVSRMRRVLVVGPPPAGKSTLAREIGARTGLPVVHLDRHYWKAGWVATPDGEWDAAVRDLASRESWVMDGNYSRTMPARIAVADTVVFLDVPRLTCLFRVIRRRLRDRRRTRECVAPGCPERLTWEFLRWIWTYPTRSRGKVLGLLPAFESRGGRVFVLRDDLAIRAFLDSLPGAPIPAPGAAKAPQDGLA